MATLQTSQAHSPAGVVLLMPPGLPSQGCPGQAGAKAPRRGGPFLGVHVAPGGGREHLPQHVGEGHRAQTQQGQSPPHLQPEEGVTTGSPGRGRALPGGPDGLSSAETDRLCCRWAGLARTGPRRPEPTAGAQPGAAWSLAIFLGPPRQGTWQVPGSPPVRVPASPVASSVQGSCEAAEPLPQAPKSHGACLPVPWAAGWRGSGPRGGHQCGLHRHPHLLGATWHHPQLQARLQWLHSVWAAGHRGHHLVGTLQPPTPAHGHALSTAWPEAGECRAHH